MDNNQTSIVHTEVKQLPREVLFETFRLQLVRPTRSDLTHFTSIYCSSKMMTYLGSPFSEEQAASRIDIWNRQWNELGWGGGIIVDKDTNTSIGTAKLILTELHDYIGSHEVGYMILPEYQGLGFACEITSGMMKYLFEHLLAKQIVANVHPNNAPSNRLLEKLGFLNQGIYSYSQPEFIGYDQQRIWLLTRENWN